MPTRDSTPLGAPCWVDLMTSDTEKARAFYSQVLGWEPGEVSEEFGGYFQFFKDGRPVAGAAPNMSGGAMPDVWSVYLASADADATLARVTEHGGSVALSSMQVADLGTMAVAIDPTGAFVRIWAPITFPGFGVVDEAGAPVWFELHTKSYDSAVDFYRNVFDWETDVMSDTDDFRYTTSQQAGESVAGILDAKGFLPEDVPSHWTVYFGVADVDGATAKVEELGGSVVSPPENTPYGRTATVADPTGTQLRLMAR